MDIVTSYSGLVAFALTVVLIPLLKFSFSRLFRQTDETVEKLHIVVEEIETKLAVLDKEIVRMQEQLKEIPELRNKITQLEKIRVEMLERYLPRGDFIREIQIMSNQMEANWKKTDQLDGKLEKLKDSKH